MIEGIKNVLSLFDGMSCGQIALNRAGINYENYFASEIDKNAIIITQKNFPNTIQLGDVKNIKSSEIPKIDLLIAGSPCQGFSFAGKQLNFNDSRSKLFFEFVKLLKELKPKYFLLENVPMKKEYEIVISKYCEIEPIYIDSQLLSAQQRKRVYWTNIKAQPYNLFGDMKANISKPKNKNIVIADIMQLPIVKKRENSIVMTKAETKVKVRKNYIDQKELAAFLKSKKNKTIREVAEFCKVKKTEAEHWFRMDACGSIPDSKVWDQLKECLSITEKTYDKAIQEFEIKNSNFDMSNRIYHIDGKHPTLMTLTGGGQRKNITDGKELFYLNPIHCERLQTVPDNYTEGVSNSQRYKMLGNGWTVDVIVHILSFLKNEKEITKNLKSRRLSRKIAQN